MLRDFAARVATWEKDEFTKWVLIIVFVLIAFAVSIFLVRLLIDLYWPVTIILFFVGCYYVDDLQRQANVDVREVPTSLVLAMVAFIVPVVTFPLSGLHVMNQLNSDRATEIAGLRFEVSELRASLKNLESTLKRLESGTEKKT